ncbi:DUF4747 family protein [Rhizobium sp.]|jgi:hypothetical protein|uniref:DUF4747 family protein n=1 Tax=Rhizobium sp. TaxID=391 RepID=UPI000E99FA9F|nr:hypothetical protein [Rhizobium sp.]
MSRNFKHEVAAINVRIRLKENRNYSDLVESLAKLKRGVRVHGNSYLAINYFDNSKNFGVISKYDEIEIDGEWFNVDGFNVASSEDLEEIVLPQNLKPNHSRFYFVLDEKIHTLVFSSYATSHSLSVNAVEKYFRAACNWKEVKEKFGPIDADIVRDHGRVEEILSLPNLREVEIIIRPPNPDDVNEVLARVIEKRLKEQNAEVYEERIKSSGKIHLIPNERTKALGNIAADNGEVKVKNVENGIVVPYTSNNMPLKEVKTFKGDTSELSIFNILAKQVLSRIHAARSKNQSAIE